MAAVAGSFLLVRYAVTGPELWHERMVLAVSTVAGWYCVLTPDLDIFMEQCSLDNGDLQGVRFIAAQDSDAFGVDSDRVYRFDEVPAGADLLSLNHRRGVRQRVRGSTKGLGGSRGPGRKWRRRKSRRSTNTAGGCAPSWGCTGGASSPGAAETGAGPGVGAAHAGKWILAAPSHQHDLKIGDEVSTMPNVGNVVGTKAVVLHEGEALFVEWVVNERVNQLKEKWLDKMTEEVGDLRVLPVKYQAGKRYRDFGDCVVLLNEDPTFDSFPEGPHTVLEDLQQIRRQGLTPQTFTAQWFESCGIPKGDRSVYEMEMLGEIVHALPYVDQLQVANLVGVAIAMRRRAVIIDAHCVSPSNPDYSASEIMVGLGGRLGGASVASSLQAFSANRLRDNAGIPKERRKAGEESRLKKEGPLAPRNCQGDSGARSR